MQKSIGFVLMICLALSCKQTSNSKLIIGTWKLPDSSKDSTVRVSFLPNKITIKQIVHELPRINSHEYKFSDDEKNIILSEKKDEGEKLEIYKLTKTELVLISKKDTLHLDRK